MKRALLILLAAASVASAQTYVTVTADTNRAIRTNYSLLRSQVSDLSGASFAISNITGLQTALDGKLATNGDAAALTNFPASLLTTNGSAAGLTNFPASLLVTNGDASGLTNFPALLLTTNSAEGAFPADLLRTNGNAAGLTNFPALVLTTNSSASAFPAALLRTNGDGSGLTNLPNADLGSATGILPLANGGTGATNASAARTALELGTAATNDATAFQPANTNLTALAGGDGSSLTNVTITDASTLTNFPSELLRTNGDAAGLTNFPAELLRTNGDGSGLTGVASYPAFSNNAGKVLAVATNEAGVEWLPVSNTVTDASLLTNFPVSLLTTNGDAAGLTNFPVELLRTNGSAAGLTSFPTLNQNTTGTASNVTGIVAIANGGTGASDVTNARVNLLPSYTGNENRILALNSNATDVIWTTNSDGGGLPETPLSISNGGTGGTNRTTAFENLLFPDPSNANSGIQIGKSASATSRSVVIGRTAQVVSGNDSIAIGDAATTYTLSGNIAIGDLSVADSRNSFASAIAIGASAVANGPSDELTVQIGAGSNTVGGVQFFTWGAVDSNKWGYLANASTAGGSRMTNTNGVTVTNTIIGYDGTNYTTNTITVIDGIITSWTQ